MLESIASNSQLYLLIFVRVFAMLQVAPLLSSGSLPVVARIALAFFSAFVLFPWVSESGYPIPETGLSFVLLLVGEILLGIITGLFLVIIYAAFQVAGQFFSLQMGFGASQVFDPLAQIEIPLMGQFLNIIAMFIFVTIGGFQRLFLSGVYRSFQAMRAVDLLTQKDYLLRVMMSGLSKLFEQALLIAFPILGTLFLISVTMGLLSKAAPQMNLLMMGFPISIGVAYLVIFAILPFLVDAFEKIIDGSFYQILEFFDRAGGG
jgi:flagellar biosynthetic protein FliR